MIGDVEGGLAGAGDEQPALRQLAAYRFDDQINNSKVFATQGYTTLLQTAPLEFSLFYNKYFHPGDGVPGCRNDKPAVGVCSTAFAMRITVDEAEGRAASL